MPPVPLVFRHFHKCPGCKEERLCPKGGRYLLCAEPAFTPRPRRSAASGAKYFCARSSGWDPGCEAA